MKTLLCITLIVVLQVQASSLFSKTLEEVANLDTSKYDCSKPPKEFLQITSELERWKDIIQNEDSIEDDIKNLKKIEHLLIKTKYDLDSSLSLIQIKDIQSQIQDYLKLLKLPQTQSKIGLA